MNSSGGVPVWQDIVDGVAVAVFSDRTAAGRAAANAAAGILQDALSRRGEVGAVFASAPSQDEFLDALAAEGGISWDRVTTFHLDEYVGIPRDDPRSFASYLRDRLFAKVTPGTVHYLDGVAPDRLAECRRYASLLAARPLDLACIGIGENGHLAFNDPPAADFADPDSVKVVTLDLRSRAQQVTDGCFATLDEVPRVALTLTLPSILGARNIVCVVPGPRKAEAVRETLLGPITPACPASGLRRHPAARLFLDLASAAHILPLSASPEQ